MSGFRSLMIVSAVLTLHGSSRADITFLREYPFLRDDVFYSAVELPGGGYACLGSYDNSGARFVRVDEYGNPLSDRSYDWGIAGYDICLSADRTSIVFFCALDYCWGLYLHVQTDFNGDSEEILSTHRKVEDLINIGAYVSGSNPKIDYAIEMIDQINNYLRQDIAESITFDKSLEDLKALFESNLN